MAAAVRPIALIDEPERVRLALSPIRRRLLDRLRAPASATQLASELEMGRQRVNYHLRALEEAGLLSLVEERQRRGCVERILVARADAFIVDPAVMTAGGPSAAASAAAAARTVQDTFAAEYLIAAAADVVRHVARMQTQAAQQGARLLTFTIDTEMSFATPADLERFTAALTEFVAREAAKTAATAGSRRYRLVIGAHPAPRTPAEKPTETSAFSGETTHDRTRSRARRDPHRRPH